MDTLLKVLGSLCIIFLIVLLVFAVIRIIAEQPLTGFQWRYAGGFISCLLLLILLFLIPMILNVNIPAVATSLPVFSVSSFEISTFSMNLTISARNPNNNAIFFYEPFSVTVTTPVSHGVKVGNGIIPLFVHWQNDTVLLKVEIGNKASVLREFMDDKSIVGVPLEISLRSKVGRRVEGPKTEVEIFCKGISVVPAPMGGMEMRALIFNPKCQVFI